MCNNVIKNECKIDYLMSSKMPKACLLVFIPVIIPNYFQQLLLKFMLFTYEKLIIKYIAGLKHLFCSSYFPNW